MKFPTVYRRGKLMWSGKNEEAVCPVCGHDPLDAAMNLSDTCSVHLDPEMHHGPGRDCDCPCSLTTEELLWVYVLEEGGHMVGPGTAACGEGGS